MISDKYFVILGGNMLLRGACERLWEYGYKVIVVDWNEKPAVIGDVHLRVDVKDITLVMDALEKLHVPIDGACSCIDLAVPTVNAINKKCGNNVMPEKFMNVLTKQEMRDCWMRDGLFGRMSMKDSDISLDEILRYNQRSKILIKPNVAASSRGITILPLGSTKSMIEQAMEKAKGISFDKACLIEEFVEGREFTIDMLGDDTGDPVVYGISVKYHSINALNNRVATKLHWNSNVYPEEVYEKIADMGKRCYKSIGLKNSFGHLEMIMREDGSFSPVEIGARSSGFIMSHLVGAAAKRDYFGDYIRMLKGEHIEHKDHINSDVSAMWYGYDIPKGIYSQKESNIAKFLPAEISVLYSKRDGLKAGVHYGDIIDDNTRDMYGYEMLVGPKEILTIENILEAEKLFLQEFAG